MTGRRGVEDLLRELAPQVLAALVRRYGQFHLCEDASQEALLAAAVQWPADGIPENPRGWLITVGTRRFLDQVRSEAARRNREELIVAVTPQADLVGPPADAVQPGRDDSLALLFGCCHPALSSPSQVALTLRAVGGLSTAQIAAAFGVPEATMAQRISRAKQTITRAGADFTLPPRAERTERLQAGLHVLYLIFNEGYSTTDGDELTVPALSREAIRLTRWLRRLLPEDSEVAGLLALMLLTDARRAARTQPDGSLVPLAEQDRSRWDSGQIAEGTALVEAALPRGTPGPYQLQAAIAAIHDEAPSMAQTDWPQILSLYLLLEALAPNPFTTLNRAVAAGMADGPQAACGCWRSWPPISGWPGITACWPPAPTCASWTASATPPPRTTCRRPGWPPACRNGATWPGRPPGCRPPPGQMTTFQAPGAGRALPHATAGRSGQQRGGTHEPDRRGRPRPGRRGPVRPASARL